MTSNQLNENEQGLALEQWCNNVVKFVYGENVNISELTGNAWMNTVSQAIQYIEKNLNNYMMFESDKLYKMCYDFPQVDLLEDELTSYIEECVKDWTIKIERASN